MAQELVLVPKEKYQNLLKSEEKSSNLEEKSPLPKENPPNNVDPPTQTRIMEILEHTIPAKYQNKAKGLLQFLSRYGGDVVSLKDNGNLIYKSDVIQGYHISDLLKHALSANVKRDPIGYQQFYKALKEIDTPTSFIHNKKMIEPSRVQSGGGYVVKTQTDGAPPGYQPPKKKKMTKSNIKWLKF